jgi:Na+/H+ antiporter NhaD/arsenite permease-like protein
MVGVSCIIIYFKLESDQVFFSSIDTLFLGFFATVFLVVEACKDTDYFEKIKNDLPFMKYRNFDESFAG